MQHKYIVDSTRGTTADYAYGQVGVTYAYTPELRGPGFNPGTSAIPTSFEENWNALVAMMTAINESMHVNYKQ